MYIKTPQVVRCKLKNQIYVYINIDNIVGNIYITYLFNCDVSTQTTLPIKIFIVGPVIGQDVVSMEKHFVPVQ
jgi:hypothetical protein